MDASWLFRAAAWGIALLAVTGTAGGNANASSQPAGVASGGKAADRTEEIRKAIASGSYEAAEDLARLALAEAEASSGADSLQVAEALDLLVGVLIRGGKATTEECLDLAQRAVKIKEAVLAPADPALATSLLNLGLVFSYAADFSAARPLQERALSIRERSLDPQHPDIARSLLNLAVLHRRMGDYPAAKAFMERAMPILEKAFGSESREVAAALTGLGTVLAHTGDLVAAKSAMERGLVLQEKILGPEHPEVARSLDNLAVVLWDMGDHAGARPLFERALDIRQRVLDPHHPDISLNLNNLANLLADMGDLQAARDLYERAIAIQEISLGLEHPEVAATLSNLATVRREMGDLPEARSLLERAVAIQQKALGEGHPDLARSLNSLADVFAASGDPSAADPLYRRSVALLEKALGREHHWVALNLNRLARLMRDQGQSERARPLFEEALSIWQKTLGPDHPLTAEGLIDLAGIQWMAGEAAPALEGALTGESIAREHLRDAVWSMSERGALRYQATRGTGLDLALSVLAAGAAPARLKDVWTEVSRSRALVLDEMAARHRALVEIDSPRVGELRRSLELARNRLTRLIINVPDGDPSEDYRRGLREAHAEKDRLERALAEASQDYREVSEGEKFEFDRMKAALPEGAGIVAYVLYEEIPRKRATPPAGPAARRYLAFVASATGEASLMQLGAAERVDDLVARWRREVTVPPADPAAIARAQRVGEELRRELWDPVAAKVAGARAVFVVPDGSLNLVNFAALPTADGRYLLESGPLVLYLSAERDLGRSAREVSAGRGLLVMGGPDFDASSVPLGPAPPSRNQETAAYRGPRSACGEFRALKFQPLPSAVAEADEIEDLWTRRRESTATAHETDILKLTGSRAAESAFKSSAPGRRMLHVATHGFFIDQACEPMTAEGRAKGSGGARSEASHWLVENPLLLSGLALAGANRRDETTGAGGEDGILTAEEIASLDLRSVEWAVLSSCGSGIGPVHAGEGVLGLRRTFQVAGARTLIMSLWAVEDHTARRWIRGLYEARLAGLSTGESVRRAGIAMIEAGRKSGSALHPFSWGAFVAAGDWR